MVSKGKVFSEFFFLTVIFSLGAIILQQRETLEIRVAITNFFSENLLLCVSFVMPVRQHAVQKEKRRQRMGFVFCSSNRFLTMQILLQVSEHYPSLDCLLQLFTSVPRFDIFMVCFKFQLSWIAQNFI